jgi:hypothetical protein
MNVSTYWRDDSATPIECQERGLVLFSALNEKAWNAGHDGRQARQRQPPAELRPGLLAFAAFVAARPNPMAP